MELTATKYKQTEVGLIPEDWEVLDLGAIGNFKNGINKSKEDFGFGFPFVNLMDVFGKPKIYGDEIFDLINSNEAERSLYNLKEGDVLFIRSSVKPSGVGLTSVINTDLINTVFSGFLIRYREKIGLDIEYKKHCFYNEKFRNELIANSSVSANTNINQDALKKLKLIVPPKSEQKAIAQVLSDTDALIQALEKKIAKKKYIKKGVMQKLLTPKEGWISIPLSEAVDYIHGKAHEQDIVDIGQYFVVNSKFISRDGKVVKYSYKNNCPAKKDDILTVLSDIPNGKALAKCFYVDEDNKYTVNQRICIWRTKKPYSKFLFYVLNRHKFFLALNDGVNQTNIGNSDIEKCIIQLPSERNEQVNIANILDDINNEILLLESKLSKYQLAKQGMMQQLLTGKIRIV
ncbi:restriction endonuclease subunit S [Flavobacteriaceae bacterium]|nr:restriction endonuclease subunit S [Flavobacteriaceae bacterium]